MSQRPQANGISAIGKNARELFFGTPSKYMYVPFYVAFVALSPVD